MEFGLSPSQSQDPQTAWAAYSMRMKHKNLTQVGGWCGVVWSSVAEAAVWLLPVPCTARTNVGEVGLGV
jgi:hypothetical protein